MMTSARGWLATVLASGLLVACSSDGGTGTPGTDAGTTTDMGSTTTDAGGDAGAMDGGTGDRPATDRPPTADRGSPAAAACESAVDLSSMTPGADGFIRVTGDNSAGAPVTLGNIGLVGMGGCINAGGGTKGLVQVYRYTSRTGGIITASTANPGTDDAMFDTVVAILPACTTTATPLGCNDDSGAAGGTGHNLHSIAATRTPVAMGTTVYIVVGGYGADAEKASSGAYELTVREAPPIAIGMPCRLAEVCATGSVCLGATAMNSGVCTADGTAPGTTCRTAAPFCDGALACSVATPSMATRGICRSQAALGQPCGTTAICSGMNFCPNFASTSTPSGDAGVASDAGAPVAARLCTAPVMETEPNNTPDMPQAAVTSTTVYRGGLSTGRDQDCYSVTVPAGATIFAETTDANGTCELGEDEDTVVRVYRQGTATPIATNDDAAMGYLCSRLNPATTTALLRVAAGTYSVCVSSFGADGDAGAEHAIATYYLTIGITPPTP